MSKDATRLASAWHDFVERVGSSAPLAKTYLLDAKPVRVTGEVVLIGFDPEFADNLKKINYPRNVVAIEHSLSAIMGRDVKVEFSVLDAQDTLPGDIRFVSTGPDTESEPMAKDTLAEERAKDSHQRWVHNPVVQRALEMFNGDILDIRE